MGDMPPFQPLDPNHKFDRGPLMASINIPRLGDLTWFLHDIYHRDHLGFGFQLEPCFELSFSYARQDIALSPRRCYGFLGI